MKLLITGEGRSGTKWLATYLKACGYEAGHESPHFGGQSWRNKGLGALVEMRQGKLPHLRYIRRRIQKAPAEWVEVSNYQIFHVSSFLACQVPVLHLIRDGRDVARSFAGRRKRKRRQLFGAPADLDYLGKLCHRWAYKMRWMLSFHFVRFEDVLADFGVLRDVLRPYGIETNERAWGKLRRKVINPTVKHAAPPWPEWTKAQKVAYWQVAGEMMESYGYGKEYPYRS